MKCSFCGGEDHEVEKLIAADDKIAICDSCVFESMKILVYGEDMIQIDLSDDLTEGDLDAQASEGC
jgi:ATP-dependent protease Clp ATPase subunit